MKTLFPSTLKSFAGIFMGTFLASGIALADQPSVVGMTYVSNVNGTVKGQTCKEVFASLEASLVTQDIQDVAYAIQSANCLDDSPSWGQSTFKSQILVEPYDLDYTDQFQSFFPQYAQRKPLGIALNFSKVVLITDQEKVATAFGTKTPDTIKIVYERVLPGTTYTNFAQLLDVENNEHDAMKSSDLPSLLSYLTGLLGDAEGQKFEASLPQSNRIYTYHKITYTLENGTSLPYVLGGTYENRNCLADSTLRCN